MLKIGDSVIITGSIEQIIVNKDGTIYGVRVSGGEAMFDTVRVKAGYLQPKGEA